MKEESEKKKLLRVLAANPTLTVEELAREVGLTPEQVEEILSRNNED